MCINQQSLTYIVVHVTELDIYVEIHFGWSRLLKFYAMYTGVGMPKAA